MAVLRKRKKKNAPKGYVWIVDYVDNEGRRRWFNTRTSSRRIAEKIRAKIEVDLALDRVGMGNLGKRVRLSTFVKSFLEYSKVHHAQATYQMNAYFLRNFAEFVGDVYVDRITREDVERYKQHRLASVSKGSVNVELKHLRSAFSYAVRVMQCLKENPFSGVQLLRKDEGNLPAFLTVEQIERLLEVIEDLDFRELIQFYIYTGCRRAEALGLDWQDVDLERRRVTIRRTKGKKDREVPVSSKLYEILQARKARTGGEGRVFPFDRHYVTHKFKRYARLAGLDDHFSLHSLRHTFASHLVMSGVDLYTVQKLLGHSDIKVTEMYAHLAPDYLALGVEKLPY